MLAPAAPAPPGPITTVAAGVPFFTAINVGTIAAILKAPIAPAAAKWCAFGLVAYCSAWSSTLLSMRTMLLAAARGQPFSINMVPNMDWFNALRMPSWTPPGVAFPIAWLLVSKPTQMAACVRLTSALGSPPWAVISLWALHLSLGDAWNEVFFERQRVGLGAVVIIIFYAALLATAVTFARLDRMAGLLMLPTCLWVTVAASLNLAIWWLNRGALLSQQND